MQVMSVALWIDVIALYGGKRNTFDVEPVNRADLALFTNAIVVLVYPNAQLVPLPHTGVP
jgi:hypothetical protein